VSTSASDLERRPAPAVTAVIVTDEAVQFEPSDGRTVSAPLAWYPRLAHGTPAERAHWRLVGRGAGVHWPDLGEDISVEGVLAGRPFGESQSLSEAVARVPRGRRLTCVGAAKGAMEAAPAALLLIR